MFRGQAHRRLFPKMHFKKLVGMLLVVLQIWAKWSEKLRGQVMTRPDMAKLRRHPWWLPIEFCLVNINICLVFFKFQFPTEPKLLAIVPCFGLFWGKFLTHLWRTSRQRIGCCKAHAKINRKTENSTLCKIVTPENFSPKLCARDYVRVANHHTNFGANWLGGGFSPTRWNISPLWLFWRSCPFFLLCSHVAPLDQFSCFISQMTCFHTRRCLLG